MHAANFTGDHTTLTLHRSPVFENFIIGRGRSIAFEFHLRNISARRAFFTAANISGVMRRRARNRPAKYYSYREPGSARKRYRMGTKMHLNIINLSIAERNRDLCLQLVYSR